MKKMNSSDTPLGTLDKQRKKQEKLQTPYLVLSGTGKETGYVDYLRFFKIVIIICILLVHR